MAPVSSGLFVLGILADSGPESKTRSSAETDKPSVQEMTSFAVWRETRIRAIAPLLNST